MIKIGITGGIGSGKSVVCKILSLHNLPVYDADIEAKNLNDISPIIREQISKHFGEELYATGVLDKKKFAEIIFNNPLKLKTANSIIHPEVENHFLKWLEKHKTFPVVAIESAILFESMFKEYTDFAVTVVAPMQTRIERVIKRSNTNIESIKARIENQMSDEERVKLSDFVIINDEKKSLLSQVNDLLHNKLNTNLYKQ